jgi:hypothetical protein
MLNLDALNYVEDSMMGSLAYSRWKPDVGCVSLVTNVLNLLILVPFSFGGFVSTC